MGPRHPVVTGATGYIGSAVVRELLDAGHQVVGLARSDASAAALTAAGAEVHRGALDDLDSLRSGAVAADGVIHLAYVHDFSDIEASGAIDLRAVETIGAVLEGTGKPFVNTSGTLVLPPGRLGTEEDAGPAGVRRVDSEDATLSMAERGVRSSVVRLAPTVHGDGDKHGFVPSLIGTAGEEGVPFADIAGAIGRRLKLPVAGITAEEAGDHFGWLAALVSIDNPTSSALTRARLDWQPEGPTLIEDLEQDHYFKD